MKKIVKILAVINIVCLMLVVFSSVAFAYELLEPLPVGSSGQITNVTPGVPGSLGDDGTVTFSDYAAWFFRFALAVAAFLAVIQISIAGAQIIVGGAMESSRKSAKARIWDAVWGLLLAFGSWLILYTINPDLASMEFSVPQIEVFTVKAGEYKWVPVPGGEQNSIACTNIGWEHIAVEGECTIKRGPKPPLSANANGYACCFRVPPPPSPTPPAPLGTFAWEDVSNCSSKGSGWVESDFLTWCYKKHGNPSGYADRCCFLPEGVTAGPPVGPTAYDWKVGPSCPANWSKLGLGLNGENVNKCGSPRPASSVCCTQP